jgi:hypothetical protein
VKVKHGGERDEGDLGYHDVEAGAEVVAPADPLELDIAEPRDAPDIVAFPRVQLDDFDEVEIFFQGRDSRVDGSGLNAIGSCSVNDGASLASIAA